VFGDLFRTQAYKDAGGVYRKCPGVTPAPVGTQTNSTDYCGDDNNHYSGYVEPSWADGGSRPIIFPWLALQTGLRFKPSKEFVGRLDLGFATSGFFLGAGVDYGI
jgi:hypothetical protein